LLYKEAIKLSTDACMNMFFFVWYVLFTENPPLTY
jgi:hypothetical protein